MSGFLYEACMKVASLALYVYVDRIPVCPLGSLNKISGPCVGIVMNAGLRL